MSRQLKSRNRASQFLRSQHGFTGAEIVLVLLVALALILVVTKIILHGSEQGAQRAAAALAQQSISGGPGGGDDIHVSAGRDNEDDNKNKAKDVDDRQAKGPGYYGAASKTREFGFAFRHPVIASQIGDFEHGSTNISTNAIRFSTNDLGLKENSQHEGSETNAFRHVLWQAEITKRFGEQIAHEVGNAHEDNPYAIAGKERQKHTFDSLLEADQSADLRNNEIGRSLGLGASKGGKMNELALKVLEEFHTNGLWVAERGADNKWHLVRSKLSDAAYNEAKTRLQQLNENGFDPTQQAEHDKEG